MCSCGQCYGFQHVQSCTWILILDITNILLMTSHVHRALQKKKRKQERKRKEKKKRKKAYVHLIATLSAWLHIYVHEVLCVHSPTTPVSQIGLMLEPPAPFSFPHCTKVGSGCVTHSLHTQAKVRERRGSGMEVCFSCQLFLTSSLG